MYKCHLINFRSYFMWMEENVFHEPSLRISLLAPEIIQFRKHHAEIELVLQ